MAPGPPTGSIPAPTPIFVNTGKPREYSSFCTLADTVYIEELRVTVLAESLESARFPEKKAESNPRIKSPK
jgi:hypothetical protein